jgi:hypothetical protein
MFQGGFAPASLYSQVHKELVAARSQKIPPGSIHEQPPALGQPPLAQQTPSGAA